MHRCIFVCGNVIDQFFVTGQSVALSLPDGHRGVSGFCVDRVR